VLNFNDYEQISRDKFQTLFLNKINVKQVYWSNLKDHYDCIFKFNNKIIITELKDRHKQYENYDDLLLEYDKYQSLLNIKKEIALDYPRTTILILYVHTFRNSNKMRLTYLNEHLEQKDFIKQVQQKSQVLTNGYKVKLVRYIDDRLHKIKKI